MASSANPYEHYNSPAVDDDDLIDPDDGMRLLRVHLLLIQLSIECIV